MSANTVRLSQLCDPHVAMFRAEAFGSPSFMYIDVSAVDARTKRVTDPKDLQLSEAPSRAKSIVREDDIIVSNVRPGLNAVARVGARLDGAVCSSAFTVLRPRDGVHPDYLFCVAQSPQFVDRLSKLAHGASYPAVTERQVLATQVLLPTQLEQIAIARKLVSGLHASRTAIEACRSQLELVAAFTKRLFTDTFGRVSPIRAGAACSGPSGFAWHPLQSLARLESGHTPSRRHPEWWGGAVPWLALPDIRKLHGKIAHDTGEHTNDLGLANSSARLLPVNTVCVSRTASIGFVTIMGRAMATSQDFCNWVCDPDQLDPEFLMYAFMASQDSLRELGSGAVHKTIYMPTIQSFHICAPGIEEQRRIVQRLRARLAAAEALQVGLRERLAEIERLPQRILAVAFDSLA